MKKILLFTALVLLSVCRFSQASETEEVFLTAQGKLILPHLNIDGQIYYVELTRIGTTGYDFRLQTPTVTVITPGADVWATPAQIIGNWKLSDNPALKLSINGDGTFTLDTPFDPTELNCPAGRETGTYRYDSTTGIFITTVKTDTDGTCGFSHPNGPGRIKKSSSGLTLIVKDNGVVENNSLIPQ